MRASTDTALAEKLDSALPQTQCTRCGYPHCQAYAEALARGAAEINQCPPGGEATIRLLARLLDFTPKPLDPKFGAHEPRRRAVIDEARCIGCRKCIDVCPVDAIVGTHQRMHTVIAAQCSGCELCLPPCPVDCIDMVPAPAAAPGDTWAEYADDEAATWRSRTRARRERLARRENRPKRREAPSHRGFGSLREAPSRDQIRAEIAAAVERVRRKRSNSLPSDRDR